MLLAGPLFGDDPVRAAALGTLLGAAYAVHFWSASGGGQTLGMRALGLRVVRTDGSPLSMSGAFLRWVGLLVSVAVVLVGVLWAAFDPQKQGWHDKIADTVVVRA